jgi:hypothetical protein
MGRASNNVAVVLLRVDKCPAVSNNFDLQYVCCCHHLSHRQLQQAKAKGATYVFQRRRFCSYEVPASTPKERLKRYILGCCRQTVGMVHDSDTGVRRLVGTVLPDAVEGVECNVGP